MPLLRSLPEQPIMRDLYKSQPASCDGRLLPIGFASGEVPSLPINLPLLKNYSIVGVFTGDWANRCPDESCRAADKVLQWVSEGKLRPHIDRMLPLERAAEAMSGIETRSVAGRIVLTVR